MAQNFRVRDTGNLTSVPHVRGRIAVAVSLEARRWMSIQESTSPAQLSKVKGYEHLIVFAFILRRFGKWWSSTKSRPPACRSHAK